MGSGLFAGFDHSRGGQMGSTRGATSVSSATLCEAPDCLASLY